MARQTLDETGCIRPELVIVHKNHQKHRCNSAIARYPSDNYQSFHTQQMWCTSAIRSQIG